MQVSLLRVLETGAFRPVGAQKDTRVDVRVIAATNIDLRDAMDRGAFRADLLHRFEVIPIHMPAFRERFEDLPALAQDFLVHVNRESDLRVNGFASGALEVFGGYSWPGNVRELRNTVARAAIMAENGMIKITHLPRHLLAAGSSASDSEVFSGEAFSPREARGRVPEQEGVYVPLGISLEEAQRAFVLRTLEYCENKKPCGYHVGIEQENALRPAREMGRLNEGDAGRD